MNNKSCTGVWVLTDDRAGNRTQAIGLADALGVGYEVKSLRFGFWSRLHNLVLGASIAGVKRQDRQLLAPPWPQLVIGAGRRTAPVARWIKSQSDGKTKIIQLGRKGGQNPTAFDATVTPVYAGLPPHPTRIETLGPLNRVSEQALSEASAAQNPFEGTPGPSIVLLLGGATARQKFGPAEAVKLAEKISLATEDLGGSLIAVASRRTGQQVTDIMSEVIGERGQVKAWRPNDPANPYLTCLAHAGIVVVTGDSESMIAEAASTGKAVYIYPLALKAPGTWARWGSRATELAAQARAGEGGLLSRIYCAMIDCGLMRPARDLSLMHTALEYKGYVKIFRGTLSMQSSTERFLETETVAETLRSMLKLDGV